MVRHISTFNREFDFLKGRRTESDPGEIEVFTSLRNDGNQLP